MAEPQVVCVLGMHRTGTSLTTRILNLLGVDLGPPSDLMARLPDNPTGFWEHQVIYELNAEILSRLGGTWDEPPRFRAHWELAPELADLRQRARRIIHDDFADAPLWGWKDPRTCLTLPFWQRLCPPLRFVLCLRNPMDTARSLERRNGFSLEKGVDLWLTHVTAALAHSSGSPRLLVFYEDVMADWARELARLAGFIGMPGRAKDVDLRHAVRAYVDAELQHHRTAIVDTMDGNELPFPAKAVYLALRSSVGLPAGGEAEPFGADPLAPVLDHFGQHAMKAQVDAAASTEDRRALERALGEMRQLQAELDRRTQEEVAREEEVQRLQGETFRLQRELEVQGSAHADRVGRLEADAARLHRDLEAQGMAHEQEARDLRATADRLRQDLEAQGLAHEREALQLRTNVASLEQRLQEQEVAHHEELEPLQMRVALLTRLVEAFQSSRSWRLTAPLRGLFASVRGRRDVATPPGDALPGRRESGTRPLDQYHPEAMTAPKGVSDETGRTRS